MDDKKSSATSIIAGDVITVAVQAFIPGGQLL
jgi:hypothetical protein